MNINDDSTTSAICHVPAFRMNLTEFQGFFGVMRRMRNISLLCYPDQDTIPQLLSAPDVLLLLLPEKSKYTTKHLMSGPSVPSSRETSGLSGKQN